MENLMSDEESANNTSDTSSYASSDEDIKNQDDPGEKEIVHN